MKKRIVLAVSILFYAGMLVLSLCARKIHNSGLPHVDVVELGSMQFYDEDGNGSYGTALPKELYRGGVVYRIMTEYINSEPRTVARRIDDLEIGRENAAYYEVVNGSYWHDRIISSDLEGITDGCEVYINETE